MKTLGVAVVLSIFSANNLAESNTLQWSTLPAMPQPLQEIYPAVHNGELIVAGGLNVSNGRLTASDKVYALSANDAVWRELPPLPKKRHHGFLVSFNDQLLLVGGFEQSEQGDWVGTSSVLQLTDNKWKVHSQLPQPQAETNVAVINGQLHIAGGRIPLEGQNGAWRNHTDTAQHWVWNASEKAWVSAEPLPSKRNSSCSVIINNDWYVIGGRTVNEGNTAVNEKYNSKTQSWTKLAPMPQAQGGLACSVMNDKIYVLGGEFFDNGGGVYNEVWVYTPSSDSWSQQGTMPEPRHGLGAVSFNGSIVLVGGANQVGARGTLATLATFKEAE